MAIFNGTKHADTLNGTSGDDRMFGDNGNDTINGGAGNDHIDGGNGSDLLSGGAGNDVIDGANGQDTVLLTGKSSDYDFSLRTDGSILVRDLRAGAADGADRLIAIERIQASDGTFKIVDLVTGNAAPIAANDQMTLAEDAGAADVTTILLANDKDPDGDALRIATVQTVSAKGAALTLSASGQVVYDAGGIFAGLETGETATDSFTYTIVDEFGVASTATATVTITGITHNRAPVAANDELTITEDAGATEVAGLLLGNDGDPDGDAFAISGVQAVSARGAAVTLGPDGKVSYDAGAIFADLDAGQTATDSFTYTITDEHGLSATATATVTISGVTQNRPPVAVGDQLVVAENAGATEVASILLANDSDADGDALTISAVQAVSGKGAAVTLSPDGKVSYDPGQIFSSLEQGQTATDSFTYTVRDAAGATSTATATVTITGVSQEPDAFFYVNEDGMSQEMWGSIIESFSMDLVAIESDGILGTLDWDLDAGTLFFTADHKSSDTLNYDQHQWTYYTAVGAEGERKLIGLMIAGVNDSAVAIDDLLSIGEGEVSANLWGVLLGNDQDIDNAAGSLRILSVGTAGTQGAVTFDAASRTVRYSAAGLDLADGETLVDTFTYTMSDGVGGSVPDVATVTVTVTGGASGGASVAMAPAAAFANAGSGAFEGEFAALAMAQVEILGADMPIA